MIKSFRLLFVVIVLLVNIDSKAQSPIDFNELLKLVVTESPFKTSKDNFDVWEWSNHFKEVHGRRIIYTKTYSFNSCLVEFSLVFKSEENFVKSNIICKSKACMYRVYELLKKYTYVDSKNNQRNVSSSEYKSLGITTYVTLSTEANYNSEWIISIEEEIE